MQVKYKVAYVTGSRADYGIVRKYLSYLNNDNQVDLSILVTGSHLEGRFGNTISIIENDNFKIDFKADICINTNSNADILKSISIATEKFGYFFEKNKYDLLIILGDRYEMLAVSQAAAIQRIPILHLHGGETTYGNYDEFIRHCITKMSRFHFTSTEVYKNRVIQMGEFPNTVFNMGALGAENCTNISYNKVCTNVRKLCAKKYFVVVFHPETLTNDDIGIQVDVLINSLIKFLKVYKVVLIGTNADTQSNIIQKKWSIFSSNENVLFFQNLNTDSYLYLIKNSICLIGNSSSGIIEAPSLKTYSINIGKRQSGRVHGDSVIDIECSEQDITNAIEKVLKNKIKSNFYNPYYKKGTAKNCYKKTKEILNIDVSSPKEFFDIIDNKVK